MLDSTQFNDAISSIVEDLADGRLHEAMNPQDLDEQIRLIALAYNKGPTNVMGRVASLASESGRFEPSRLESIHEWLRLRGAGVSRPAVICY